MNLGMITKQLNKKDGNQIENTICRYCGKKINIGLKTKDILSSNYNDYDKLKYKSDYFCLDCITLFDGKSFNGKALRNFNLLFTKNKIEILKRENILNILFNGWKEDYILQISFSYKKHCFYYYKLNKAKSETIFVATDKGLFKINRKEFKYYFELCDLLYKNEISKKEIESGKSFKFNKINKIENYQEINKKIEIIRGTQMLQLIILLLWKEKKE